MRKFLRTKRGLLIAVCVLFASVLGLSYATFIVNNGSYKATELLISKLNYGITIVEDGSTGSTIDNNSVTIPSGKTGYYVVTITSINSINTKYSLGYKTTSNATVQYTDRTAWEASGDIKGYDENTYSKKVRIVIDNSGNSSSATVSFAAFGGYTYRTIAEINLTDGYKTVTGPFTELAFSKTNKLIDVVEGDTSCTTSDTTNCLYGGGNLKNYVQFPEDEDKTKNIWRIVGSYDINGSYVTKLISETLISTTASTYVADLTTFYNTLTGIDAYIEETNYFNCYSTSCTANTNFTNIGLLTDYEFNEIGGVNTYLNRKMPFIVNSEQGLKEVTTSGYNETVSASTNARAVIYLKNKTHVINSGTEADPYILSPETDVAIIGYTVNGKATSDKFEDLLKTNLVNQITCDKGTTAVWDNETSSIKLSNIKAPDYCTIDFKDGFTVTLTAGSTGTVSAPVSQMVGYNGTVSFTVTSNTGSTELTKNTCNGVLSGNTFTISNVKESKNCEIEFSKPTLANKLLIDNAVETAPRGGAYNTVFTKETTGVIFQSTESINDDTYDVYYFAGNISNNWVKFGTYQTDDPDGKWSAGADIYWRIIRTNADGSVRLLYSGTSPDTTEGYIGKSAFNVIPSGISSRPRFMSYMYGDDDDLDSTLDGIKANTKDSTIKTYIDNWYNTYFSSYTRYLSTEAVYCNDRQLSNGQTWTFPSSDQINFAAYTRLDWENKGVNANPTYDCVDSKDAFSVENENAKLTYPIGLMTADEVNMAGGLAGNAAEAWYYFNSDYGSIIGNNEDAYCTMTPSIWSGRSANIWGVDSATDNLGALGVFGYSDTEFVVRPVISLKSCVMTGKGDGSSSSPYEIVETSSGC